MIAEAVRAMRAELPAVEVEFLHRTAPRNGPARDWLARLTRQALPPEGSLAAGDALDKISNADYPVEIQIIRHEPSRN